MSYSYTYLEDAQYRAIVLALSELPKGFYVDLGPQHPGPQSLTSVLYERGWQGASLEPVPQYLSYLNTVRPKDINLRAVAGDTDASVQYTDQGPEGWHLSPAQGTTPPPGQDWLTQITVQGLMDQHAWDALHLLRIGTQPAFIAWEKGLDWQRIRPWVVVMEDAEPGQWDSQMPAHRYLRVPEPANGQVLAPRRQVWVAQEHADLLPRLSDVTDTWLPLPPVVPLAPPPSPAPEPLPPSTPFVKKLVVAIREGRLLWTIKAHLKQDLGAVIRTVLRQETGRKLTFFLTDKLPAIRNRLRFMAPKPVYSTEVADLLARFEERMPAPVSPTESKA